VTTSGSDRSARAYLDASALVKLVVREAESEALGIAVTQLAAQASSELAVVEIRRQARKFGRDAQARARAVLGNTELRPIDRATLDLAAGLAPRGLRSLDAIHLATALSLDELDVFISYDTRLNEAAAAAGLHVESPR
jgi:predicted nucleic acid-binding protein